MARSPSPIWCGNRDPKLCWVDAKKVENEPIGSNLIADRATNEDDNFIKEKNVECPISMSWLGIAEPSPSIGESLRPAINPIDQVVKVWPGVDVGCPL